ncbi:hypothetical protein AVEN_113063-1, partial [Araneus ventricosus]
LVFVLFAHYGEETRVWCNYYCLEGEIPFHKDLRYQGTPEVSSHLGLLELGPASELTMPQ